MLMGCGKISMVNYSHLYSWRNLCEYLNSRKFKFAKPYEIKRDWKCLSSLYWRDRTHRQALFDNYLIQFIHWCPYPDFSYRRRRKCDDEWGWQLCREWEAKIDFLEQIVLFNGEPLIKTWEPALTLRIAARAEREVKLKLDKEFSFMKEQERRTKATSLNICWRCYEPMVFMMIDCVSCGAVQ